MLQDTSFGVMHRTFFSFSIIVFLLCAGIGEAASWLDQPLQNWNQPSAHVPNAPASSTDSAVRCKAHARPAENLADQALIGSGWLPFGALQSYGGTSIVTAMSEADPSCRPRNYQAFVFSEGRVAGTLSPSLMDSQYDGSIRQIRLMSSDEIEVDFARANRISTVRFEIRTAQNGPLLVPLEIRHSKEEPPAPAVAPSPTPAPPPAAPPPAPAPAAADVIRPPAAQNPQTIKMAEPVPKQELPIAESRSSFLLPITNPSLLKGCGCYLKDAASTDQDSFLFVTSILIEKRAWVNIGGKEITLRFLRSTMPRGKFKLHTGYKFQEEYASGNTHILLEYLAKRLPGEGQPFAEYDVTLTVETGTQTETIQATGICGCRK